MVVRNPTNRTNEETAGPESTRMTTPVEGTKTIKYAEAEQFQRVPTTALQFTVGG